MNIQLGGVPEHFNFPWHIAEEEGVFDEIDYEFIEFAGGTGAMTQALLNNDINLALLLTEGAIKFIAENQEYKIIKIYVDSPLVWGVHTGKTSKKTPSSTTPFAISRLGSGSHLMAYVYAQGKKWASDSLSFLTIQNLEGARNLFKTEEEALFLWEKFTTQPFVDNGEMQRIDTCPTPWPCFVLVAHQDLITENQNQLENFLDGINMCLDLFKSRPEIDKEIAEEYGITIKDAQQWLQETEWNSHMEVSEKMLNKVIHTLTELKLIQKKMTPAEIISSLTQLID